MADTAKKYSILYFNAIDEELKNIYKKMVKTVILEYSGEGKDKLAKRKKYLQQISDFYNSTISYQNKIDPVWLYDMDNMTEDFDYTSMSSYEMTEEEWNSYSNQEKREIILFESIGDEPAIVLKSAISSRLSEIILAKSKEELAKTQENGAKTLSRLILQRIVLLTLQKHKLQLSKNDNDEESILEVISFFKKNPLCFHWGDEQEYKKNLEWFEETVEFFKTELNITNAEIENEMENQEELDFRWDEEQKVYILYGTKDE